MAHIIIPALWPLPNGQVSGFMGRCPTCGINWVWQGGASWSDAPLTRWAGDGPDPICATCATNLVQGARSRGGAWYALGDIRVIPGSFRGIRLDVLEREMREGVRVPAQTLGTATGILDDAGQPIAIGNRVVYRSRTYTVRWATDATLGIIEPGRLGTTSVQGAQVALIPF